MGLETRLDGADGASGTTAITGNEIQTILALLEICVGRFAGHAGDVFVDVPTEDVLNLFLLELALDDKTSAAVDGTGSTQFGEEVLGDVLVGTLHLFADVGNIGEDGLLVAFTHTLGWRNLVGAGAAVASEVGVLALEESKEPAEKERICQVGGRLVGPNSGSLINISRILRRNLRLLGGGSTLLGITGGDASLLELSVKVLRLGHLLLLLFLEAHVEIGRLVASGVGILGLLLLLESLEELSVGVALSSI